MVKKSNLNMFYIVGGVVALIVIIILILLLTGSFSSTTIDATSTDINKEAILDSPTNTNLGSTNTTKVITIADCTKKNYTACSGTTSVIHKFELINSGCVDKPVSTYNSFDCGYIVPCDKALCEAKTNFSCEGTTKKVTEYSCNKELGCIFSNPDIFPNDINCGYKQKYSGKYTIDDINKIRQLADKCKFNLDDCGKDYYFPSIKIGEQESIEPQHEVGDPLSYYYTDINLNGIIATPFLMAVLVESQKELKYESYTDKELLILLDMNSLNFSLLLDASTIYGMGELGSIETVVIKYNGRVYNSESPQSKLYTIKGYSEIYDKKVELVIVGSKKEVSTLIDLSKYK